MADKINQNMLKQVQLKTTTAKTTAAKEVKADVKTQTNMNTLVQKFMEGGIDAKQFQAEAQKLGIAKEQITIVQNQQKILNDPKIATELQNITKDLFNEKLDTKNFVAKAEKLGLDKNTIGQILQQAITKANMKIFADDKSQPAELRSAVAKYADNQSPSLADLQAVNEAFIKSGDAKTKEAAKKVAEALSKLETAVAKKDDKAIKAALDKINDILGEGDNDDGGVEEPPCMVTWRQVISGGAHIVGHILCGGVAGVVGGFLLSKLAEAVMYAMNDYGKCNDLDNHAVACPNNTNGAIDDGCNIHGTHANANHQSGKVC